MNLMQPILYLSSLCVIIFFLYIILYKSYFLSASKISTPEQALEELLEGNRKYNRFYFLVVLYTSLAKSHVSTFNSEK